jgi:uncharacterized protein (TIGR02284 family)
MAHHIEALRDLHTTLIDSWNGYDEALQDSDEHGLKYLFSEMITMRMKHSAELADRLVELGETANDSGSFMSTVHRTIFSVRSLFGGLNETVLPGLIDGEKRILAQYDHLIADASVGVTELQVLNTQRAALNAKINEMISLKAAA